MRTKTRPPIVLASVSDTRVPRTAVLAKYECASCHHTFAADANNKPHCSKCGSSQTKSVRRLSAVAGSYLPSDKKLSSLTCPKCRKHNIVPDSAVLAYAGKMHCVSCGTALKYNARALAATTEDMTSGQQRNQLLSPAGYRAPSLTAPVEPGDDIPINPHLDNTGPTDILDPIDPTLAALDDEDAISEKKDKEKPNAKPKDSSEEDDEFSLKDSEDDDEDDEDSPEAKRAAKEMAVKALMALVDAFTAEEASTEYSFVQPGQNTILAFVKDVCVARLDNRDDYDHRAIFGQKTHLKALHASVRTNGLQTTLDDFGFKKIRVPVRPGLFKKRAVEKAALEEKARIRSELSNLKTCLAVAAAGMNKNFFHGKNHPLKAAFYDVLSSAGVRSPEKLIDTVFASASDSYHRTLIETALDLMSKPAEIRNSVAAAIAQTNYVATDVDEDLPPPSPEPDLSSEVEDRLERTLQPAVEASVTDLPRVSNMRGRLFSVVR